MQKQYQLKKSICRKIFSLLSLHPQNQTQMIKIYLASSWRNNIQQKYVKLLREAGFEVYDFKHPTNTEMLGFHWEDVDTKFRDWSVKDY